MHQAWVIAESHGVSPSAAPVASAPAPAEGRSREPPKRAARRGPRGPGGPRALPRQAGRHRLRRVKIYTRTGDDGRTGILGPDRVVKSDARVEACGSVDELNAALGVARTLDLERWLEPEISRVQAKLFQLGAELATADPAMLARLTRLTDDDVAALERWIDRCDAELRPLAKFILPGGSPLGANLHLARTICRRAERRVVALSLSSGIEPRLVRYLNRLADTLFVLARWCNARSGAAETEWPA
jgi:cob(I)alamin adenosyltransferase